MPLQAALKVSGDLFLVSAAVAGATTKPADQPVHHVVWIDVSGSMSGELPHIRRQLKNRLATTVGPQDRVTIGWFSGARECDTLVEAKSVEDLRDVQALNRAIDRLQPVGLTCFVDPVKRTGKILAEWSKRLPDHAVAMFFMSDGQHNSGGTIRDILAACDETAGGVGAATCVAYGWYADLPTLTKMAERWGGSVIQAEGFERYEPVFEGALRRRVGAGKKVAVTVGDAIGGVAFALRGGEILTFAVEGGEARVPADLGELFYLAPSLPKGVRAAADLGHVAEGTFATGVSGSPMDAAYAAVSAFALRGMPKVVRPLLRALGDVTLIQAYTNAFGKQKIAAFVDAALKAATGEGRFTAGRNPALVPRDDAFTLLDLIGLLREEEGNRVMLDDSAFTYTRIGRKQVDAGEVITPREAEELADLWRKAEESGTVEAHRAHATRHAAILATKGEALTFTANEAPNGYPVSNIVTNEKRPNVSISITREGTVDLTGRIPAHLTTHIPTVFRTKQTRTYTIVKDGLVHVRHLPVRLTRATWARLAAEGVVPAEYSAETVVLDLDKLPIVNAKMLGDLSAKQMAEMQYELLQAQARAKVLRWYREQRAPKVSTGFLSVHGTEATEWLKGIGLTDGGFNPRTTAAPATDKYLAKEVTVALKGLSSAVKGTKVEEVVARLADLDAAKPKTKPLTPGQALFVPAIREVEAKLKALAKGDAVGASDFPERDMAEYLHTEAGKAEQAVRLRQAGKAEAVFSIAVGGAWPAEFKDVTENTLTVKLGGADVVCSVELDEPEESI